MIAVIIIMTVGIILGVAARKQSVFMAFADHIITYAIWLLLFLLGISIGVNEGVIRNIGELGLQALVVAVLAIGCSIFLAYLLFVFLFKDEN